MVKDFVRCGLCDMNFNSTEEWVRHSKTDMHTLRLDRYAQLVAEGKAFMGAEKLVKKIRDEVQVGFRFR